MKEPMSDPTRSEKLESLRIDPERKLPRGGGGWGKWILAVLVMLVAGFAVQYTRGTATGEDSKPSAASAPETTATVAADPRISLTATGLGLGSGGLSATVVALLVGGGLELAGVGNGSDIGLVVGILAGREVGLLDEGPVRGRQREERVRLERERGIEEAHMALRSGAFPSPQGEGNRVALAAGPHTFSIFQNGMISGIASTPRKFLR